MSEEKTLEDVIGFLMNVAEFDLAKTKRVPIPGGAMTVTSENYQFMYEVIDWIEDKIKEPELNENQEIVLDWLKEKYQMGDIELFTLLWRLHVNSEMKKFKERPVYVGFRNLSDKEQAQILQAFATWALDQC